VEAAGAPGSGFGSCGGMCGLEYQLAQRTEDVGPWIEGKAEEVVMVVVVVVVVQSSSSWLVYERFLLPSRFLKLDGLIFISANSMECSWPFQWNQLTPLL